MQKKGARQRDTRGFFLLGTTRFQESYKFLDRGSWGPGPWDSEKDFYRWTDSLTKLECVVVRTNMGVLTGNVLLPPMAPVIDSWTMVHGQRPRVASVLDHRAWSFHCATDGDAVPAIHNPNRCAYRGVDYVIANTKKLAVVVADALVDHLRKELPRGWFGTLPYPHPGINDPEIPGRN